MFKINLTKKNTIHPLTGKPIIMSNSEYEYIKKWYEANYENDKIIPVNMLNDAYDKYYKIGWIAWNRLSTRIRLYLIREYWEILQQKFNK